MEERIKINDENLEIYRDYVEACEGKGKRDPKITLSLLALTLTTVGIVSAFAALSVILGANILGSLTPKIAVGFIASSIFINGPVISCSCNLAAKLTKKSMIQKFQKEHPDFNITLDHELVELAIVRYYYDQVEEQIEEPKKITSFDNSAEEKDENFQEKLEIAPKDEVLSWNLDLLTTVEEKKEATNSAYVKSKIDDIKRRQR